MRAVVDPIAATVVGWLTTQLLASGEAAAKQKARDLFRGNPVDKALDVSLNTAIRLTVEKEAQSETPADRLRNARLVLREVWDRPDFVAPQPSTRWLDRVHHASKLAMDKLLVPHGVEPADDAETPWQILSEETGFEVSAEEFTTTFTATPINTIIFDGAQPGSALKGIADELGRAVDNEQANARLLSMIAEVGHLPAKLATTLDEALARYTPLLAEGWRPRSWCKRFVRFSCLLSVAGCGWQGL